MLLHLKYYTFQSLNFSDRNIDSAFFQQLAIKSISLELKSEVFMVALTKVIFLGNIGIDFDPLAANFNTSNVYYTKNPIIALMLQ